MFKYILVPATGSGSDVPVFRTAAAAARLCNAHLVFLHVRLDVEKLVVPIASAEFGGGAGVGELIESLERETIVRHDRAKSTVYSFCAEAGIAMSTTPVDDAPTAEWRMETGDEADRLALAGRAADLTVLGRLRGDRPASTDTLNTALMHTGRPLLLAPENPPAQIGQTVAIAWKDTAEAASAVAAALPLLAGARQVAILSVTEDAKADEAACERLREALVWHNPVTTVRKLSRAGGEPGDVLLSAAADLGADLLVMGGYSRSRGREIVFGGFTRRILRSADLPVLLAH